MYDVYRNKKKYLFIILCIFDNDFTCAGLKYFVDRIRAFSNIRTNAIMRSLIFPYANAEHVTSLLAIFVNMKTEPVFVKFKLINNI
jgi:hypothetical protein